MQNDQYIGAPEAARLKGMGIALFHYHVKRGHVPEPAFVSGKQRFWERDAILVWTPQRSAR